MLKHNFVNVLKAKYNTLRRFVYLNSKPLYLMVEPTNYCDLKCPLCPTGSGELRVPRGYMDYSKFKTLVDELSNYVSTMLMWGFGEPMLHPDILSMISLASRNKIRTKISTNGQHFTDRLKCKELVRSNIDQIRISLDGASDDTLRVYRKGASFDKIVCGINYLLEEKKAYGKHTPMLILQFIEMKHNSHETILLKRYAKEHAMVFKVKTVSCKSRQDADSVADYLPDTGNTRYKTCTANNRKVIVPTSNRPKVCPYPWLWGHINWDGSVVPCCKDPNRTHNLGNAFLAGGFLKIWNNDNYLEFRKKYLKDPYSLERCNKCDYVFK